MRAPTRRLLKPYLDKGYVLVRQRNHFFLRHPDGRTLTIPKTGSDPRGDKNTLSRTRRSR